jgi:hypothetical protein
MPYLPLIEALWAATRDPAAAPAVHDAVRDRPVLGRLLPDSADGPGGDGELARQQLFGAVLGLLGELGDAHPVLFVLEDLHWADHSTRDLLMFLSRVLQRERVCLVGTYRTDDLHRRHPLRPVLAELFRLPTVSAVELPPLAATEMADHLSDLAGERLPPDVLDRLIERAEGNAFYAEELLAAAATGEELPAGLADLLLARLERLSEIAQRVVRIAAVAGPRADDDLIREVTGLDETPYDRALREIVSHQLLVPDGGDGYTFRHALLREAVYGDLLPGERTRLHAAFAALLRERSRRSTAVRGDIGSAAAHNSAVVHNPAAGAGAPVLGQHRVRAVACLDGARGPRLGRGRVATRPRRRRPQAVAHRRRCVRLWLPVRGRPRTVAAGRGARRPRRSRRGSGRVAAGARRRRPTGRRTAAPSAGRSCPPRQVRGRQA